VIRSAKTKNQSSHSILHRQEATDNQLTSHSIVQPAEDKSSDKRLKDGRRDELADAAQLT